MVIIENFIYLCIPIYVIYLILFTGDTTTAVPATTPVPGKNGFDCVKNAF